MDESAAGEENLPSKAKIRSVSGRKAESRDRGAPAIDRIELEHGDGTVRSFELGVGRAEGRLQFVAPIGGGAFAIAGKPACPICFEPGTGTDEHVPGAALGGDVMTRTCKRCNNGLGSTLEGELQDWFDGVHRRFAVQNTDVAPGRRRLPDTYIRRADDGSFALIMNGSLDESVHAMLKAGAFTLEGVEHDMYRVQFALLKHAYLAACLFLRQVPQTEEAAAIRNALVAVRDGGRRHPLPELDAARRVRYFRSSVGIQGPPLALVARIDDDEAELLISLAGSLFVTWPFDDSPAGDLQVVEIDESGQP